MDPGRKPEQGNPEARLAEALFLSGDPAAAMATQENAVAVFEKSERRDPGQPEAFERSLARFREAAATRPAPSDGRRP